MPLKSHSLILRLTTTLLTLTIALLSQTIATQTARAQTAPTGTAETTPGTETHATDNLRQQILETMQRATAYMMDSVSYRGGFVWNYLPDRSRQWGEMEARPTMAWLQAPGTPQVGHVLLDAYHATGDEGYYEAAERVARALIWGQLSCGGWNYVFDFAGEGALQAWYATVGQAGWRLEEFQHYYGNATFDDGVTMDAAKFLLRLYVEKNDPTYRPALEKVINLVLTSQYPSGGWPQRFPLMYDHPFQGQADYTSFITLNDDVMPDIIEFLTYCYQALGRADVREPVFRAMYLTIALQQGAPYAGWADQYTVSDLKPAHARSYEPRSVNTGTTARMILLMLDYFRLTADTRFLAGIPAALNFLEQSTLPKAEAKKWERPARDPEAVLMPRFIDPETGQPLYVHRVGTNVYNGHYFINDKIEGTIGHYSSAAWVNISALRQAYEEAKAEPLANLKAQSPLLSEDLTPLPTTFTPLPRDFNNSAENLSETAERLINTLSPDGYWLTPLRQTSNPYLPLPNDPTLTSTETRYAQTMVGDEYDTSPFSPSDGQLCISTADYINHMRILIECLASSR